jgi:ATP-dependent DNA helicase PIF1
MTAALLNLAAQCELNRLEFDSGAALAVLCSRRGRGDALKSEWAPLLPRSQRVLEQYKACATVMALGGRLMLAKRFDVHSRLMTLTEAGSEKSFLRIVDGNLRLTAKGLEECRHVGIACPEHPAMSRAEEAMALRLAERDRISAEGDSGWLGGLSAEQRAVVQLGRSGASMLVTGPAGTGKSLTLTKLVQAIKRDGRRVVVTASTGIAACGVGGVTLHAFAGVGDARKPAAELARLAMRNSKTVRKWQSIDCIVIEEVSMVGSELLEKVDAVARACRGRDRPMGGAQTVLVGDFHQLPPVVKAAHSTGGDLAFESPLWNKLVQHTVVLGRVFRQSDRSFVRALHSLRCGTLEDAEDQKLLRERCVPAGTAPVSDAVVLCPRNAEADEINQSRLHELPGAATLLEASFRQSRDGTEAEHASLRRQLERGCLAPQSLKLKPGAAVVLLANLDLARGLVNGTRGEVQSISEDGTPTVVFQINRGEAPKPVAAAAPDRDAGRHATQHTPSSAAATAPAAGSSGSLTMELGQEKFMVSDGAGVWVARVQYPVRLAWALSIHKSQGMTIDRLWVRCGHIWEAGQAYVALSRARRPDALWLEGFDAARHVRVHPRVEAFYAGLGTASDAAVLASRQERRRSRGQPGREAARQPLHPSIFDRKPLPAPAARAASIPDEASAGEGAKAAGESRRESTASASSTGSELHRYHAAASARGGRVEVFHDEVEAAERQRLRPHAAGASRVRVAAASPVSATRSMIDLIVQKRARARRDGGKPKHDRGQPLQPMAPGPRPMGGQPAEAARPQERAVPAADGSGSSRAKRPNMALFDDALDGLLGGL